MLRCPDYTDDDKGRPMVKMGEKIIKGLFYISVGKLRPCDAGLRAQLKRLCKWAFHDSEGRKMRHTHYRYSHTGQHIPR